MTPDAATAQVHLPADECREPRVALQREWLVTNGVGGFGLGTVAGGLTRRYHGLLVAALRPPLGRTLLVAKCDEVAEVAGRSYKLATNVWRDGVEEPAGCRLLEGFDLVLGVPTWTYGFAGVQLVRRVWMEPGANCTYLQYEFNAAPGELRLTGRFLVNYRDYHRLTRADGWQMRVVRTAEGLRVDAFGGAVPVRLSCLDQGAQATWTPEHTWYRDFSLLAERERGFDFLEDHLSVGTWTITLKPGQTVTFAAAAESVGDAAAQDSGHALDSASALARRQGHSHERLKAAGSPVSPAGLAPPIAQLVLAADQFVVDRRVKERPGHTVIAGYPWFADWGRDTMISLPGLTLATGRADIARQILQTWAQFVDRGMIPNRFPDEGERPEYNSVDAALWFLWAIDQYVRATGDQTTLAQLFPVMADMVHWFRRGTRFGIQVDDDGLVYAGQDDTNLTWMDAKHGDYAFTPRVGKPVELSALWYDALLNMADFAARLGQPATDYQRWAGETRASFARFWNPARQCCFDVIDGPRGNDGSLRPNQIFAVALEHSPLSHAQQLMIVNECERALLTPFGLRTLAASEPQYHPRYEGGPAQRDAAYHQGAVWGWLLGPFVIAHYRVHGDQARARALLEGMFANLRSGAVGSLSEIFDAEPPHTPRGCPAQAWTVAETLRAWAFTQGGTIRLGS